MIKTHARLAGIIGAEDERSHNDFYPTPPYVTRALVTRIDLGERVLEPAAGRGYMARELIGCGHAVTARDLHAYGDPLCEIETGVDFLGEDDYGEFDAVVTNPPYLRGAAEKFVVRALAGSASVVAVLQRLSFMESSGRYARLFSSTPPRWILPFSRRFPCSEDRMFAEPFGGMIPYAWYVWNKYAECKTEVKWIDSNAAHADWLRADGMKRYEGVNRNAKDDRGTDSVSSELRTLVF